MTAMLDVLGGLVAPKLDANALILLSSVSRDMHEMCTKDELWERLMREDFRWAWEYHKVSPGPFIEAYGELVRYCRSERRVSLFSLSRLLRSLRMYG